MATGPGPSPGTTAAGPQVGDRWTCASEGAAACVDGAPLQVPRTALTMLGLFMRPPGRPYARRAASGGVPAAGEG